MYLVFLLLFTVTLAFPADDLVTKLPYLDDALNFRFFSGYLHPRRSPKRHLHYVFLESQNSPGVDPLVIWFNGGPGCSSMDGLLYEHGPYLINSDGKSFTKNEKAWNKVANILYIESPIGVGFSYSDDERYVMDDTSTTKDAADAIENFFEKFSSFQGRKTYITGESYAGVYVPALCLEIKKRGKNSNINLQGFGLGNGISSYELNDNSLMFFAYHHGLFSETLWENLITHCCQDGIPLKDRCNFHNSYDPTCEKYVLQGMNAVYSSGVNFYNLYGTCEHASVPKYKQSLDLLFQKVHLLKSKRPHLQKSKYHANVPCIDSDGADIYLNLPEVQKALNVITQHGREWAICSHILSYERQFDTMRPVYDQLFEIYKLPGLHYNGDTDMACNFIGNNWFVESLDRKVTSEWKSWRLPNDAQVSGFVQKYDYLTFYTIKGAGHMVPQWKPDQALYILIHLLHPNNPYKLRQLESKFWGTSSNVTPRSSLLNPSKKRLLE